MTSTPAIPAFGLYGEANPFPDVIQCESFMARAPIYGWRIRAHRHGQMAQLFMLDKGRVECVVDGQKLERGSGDFLFIPARCVHEFDFDPGTIGNVISFPLSLISGLKPLNDELQSVLARPFWGESTAQLEAQVAQLLEVARAHGMFRTSQVVGLAHCVLATLGEVELSGLPTHIQSTPARLGALDQLIAQKMSKGWGPAQYASALAVTTGHLSRMCRKASGLGAAAYLEQRVMEEGCRMLAFTQLPISDIGYRLGYADPSYFSKRFRRAMGATPTEYRSRFMA